MGKGQLNPSARLELLEIQKQPIVPVYVDPSAWQTRHHTSYTIQYTGVHRQRTDISFSSWPLVKALNRIALRIPFKKNKEQLTTQFSSQISLTILSLHGKEKELKIVSHTTVSSKPQFR